MKNVLLYIVLLMGAVIAFSACNSTDKSSSDTEDTTINNVPESDNPYVMKDPPLAEPAQNADGVWHYTCEKGCAGGAGKASNCAKCGSPLLHNQAYHGGANANTNTTTPDPMTLPPPKTPEPAQNASGVWHYTCAKGCPGGGGAAGACSGCGGALAHNAVYHQ